MQYVMLYLLYLHYIMLYLLYLRALLGGLCEGALVRHASKASKALALQGRNGLRIISADVCWRMLTYADVC